MNAAVYVVGALLLWASGALKLPKLGHHDEPPTAQLQAAEQQLAAAKAAQAQAEAALAAAQQQQAARTAAQLDYAQQMAVGTSSALARVPVEHQVPEVKLATELSTRAVAGLEAARGKLSPEQQAEMDALIAKALSSVQAERDAYKAALAAKDAQLAQVTTEKARLAAEIPALQSEVTTRTAEVAVKDATVQTKTAEVATWADKKAAADARADSFDARAGLLLRIVIAIGMLYLAIHYLLPCLAQSYPGVGWLTKAAAAAKNFTTAHT